MSSDADDDSRRGHHSLRQIKSRSRESDSGERRSRSHSRSRTRDHRRHRRRHDDVRRRHSKDSKKKRRSSSKRNTSHSSSSSFTSILRSPSVSSSDESSLSRSRRKRTRKQKRSTEINSKKRSRHKRRPKESRHRGKTDEEKSLSSLSSTGDKHSRNKRRHRRHCSDDNHSGRRSMVRYCDSTDCKDIKLTQEGKLDMGNEVDASNLNHKPYHLNQKTSSATNTNNNNDNLPFTADKKVAKPKGPMTQQQYLELQSQIREVFDPQTGRTRLVRGTGEIIERIVTKKEHSMINQSATFGDGWGFARTVSKIAIMNKTDKT